MAEKVKTYVPCDLCGGYFLKGAPRTIHFEPKVYRSGRRVIDFCQNCTQEIRRALAAQDRKRKPK